MAPQFLQFLETNNIPQSVITSGTAGMDEAMAAIQPYVHQKQLTQQNRVSPFDLEFLQLFPVNLQRIALGQQLK